MSILVSPPGYQEKVIGNYSKKVNVLVNIAIIAIAVLIGIGFVMTHPFAETPHFASRIIVGSRTPLSNIDRAKNEHTLLLVLQKGCCFCSENAPFYQQLVQETAGRESVRLIAVLPQSSDESKQYLEEIGVPIKQVK